MVGPSILHGPHHSAQKSTITGTGDCKTSLSKVLSLRLTTFFPAMLPPASCYSIGYKLLDYQRSKRSQRGSVGTRVNPGGWEHGRARKTGRKDTEGCLPEAFRPFRVPVRSGI